MQDYFYTYWVGSQADGKMSLKHDEGYATLRPSSTQKSANWLCEAGVDELDVNGRSLNHPVPTMVIQISVCEGA
jgi:hypothetical protein